MSDFEFIFALFGLLLGLSLAEVLAGLARAIEAKLIQGAAVKIGWLTPLLAAFVLLDLLSFWQAAWINRDIVVVSGRTLMAVMIFAGAYYLVRRIVLGVMLVLLVCQLGWYLSVPALAGLLARPLAVGLTIVLVLLMIAAMVVRGPRWSRVAMLALVARYVVVYLI
ncbi:MAG: hypothetical protein B7Z43_05625 [Sphingomonas sp. 12-62-6]|nr:MAG: hypothetical protein B7Z43_05625 [Sphingomonas sp. 12-62-6]